MTNSAFLRGAISHFRALGLEKNIWTWNMENVHYKLM